MSISRKLRALTLPFLLLLAVFWTCTASAATASREKTWRIRFLDAAVVRGPYVTLGEIAVPAGDMPPGLWQELAARKLWPAPDEAGRPMNMTRPRLQEAVVRTMKDLAPYCLFPPSMAVQRGGALLGKEEVRRVAENGLTPYLGALPGEARLTDFRLPAFIFLGHGGQTVVLEEPRKVSPGRLSLRLLVKEVDGSIRNRLTGSVMVECWADAPFAAGVMNRDDILEHGKVTFKRVNIAGLRGEIWDGRGGPWRVLRPMALDQVILKSDLGQVPTVRKNDRLMLVYEGKTVRLTVPVEALSDGTVGETIAVRNTQSRKEIYGTVRDGKTVVVESAR